MLALNNMKITSLLVLGCSLLGSTVHIPRLFWERVGRRMRSLPKAGLSIYQPDLLFQPPTGTDIVSGE